MSDAPPSTHLDLPTSTAASFRCCYVANELLICVLQIAIDPVIVGDTMLQHGILSTVFGREGVHLHVQDLFKTRFGNLLIKYDGQTRCFFLDEHSLGHHRPICLDFASVKRPFHLLHQKLWRPMLNKQIYHDLKEPIFLDWKDGRLSVTVSEAMNMSNKLEDLHAVQSRPEIEFKSSTQIHLVGTPRSESTPSHHLVQCSYTQT